MSFPNLLFGFLSQAADILLTESVSDLYQIKNVDYPITVEVWRGFAEPISDLHQIQDVDFPIAVDVNDTSRYQVLQG